MMAGQKGITQLKRFYIFKDGTMIGAAPTKDEAIEMIRQRQKRETHPILRSEFSIIEGVQEFIKYEKEKR